MAASADSRRILLGKIVGVHGVQGWVKIHSYTEPRAAIFEYRPWWVRIRDEEREIVPLDGREQAKGLIAQLPGCIGRDQARLWVGGEIRVNRCAMPEPEENQFYWCDLEGLAVVTPQGQALGTVSHLFSTGSNDVLVVHGERERLIPFIQPDVVRHVDLKNRRIEVDWDPGF